MDDEVRMIMDIESKWKSNDYDGCISLCSTLIEQSPSTRPSLYIRRGYCYLYQSDFNKALKDAQDALHMQQHLASAHALFAYSAYESIKALRSSSFLTTTFESLNKITSTEHQHSRISRNEMEYLAVMHIIRARQIDSDMYNNNDMFIKYWTSIVNDTELPNGLRYHLSRFDTDMSHNNSNGSSSSSSDIDEEVDHLMLRDDQVTMKSQILIILCILSSHTMLFSSRMSPISWMVSCIQDARSFSEFCIMLEKMERSIVKMYQPSSIVIMQWNRMRPVWIHSLQRAETITHLYLCLKCFHSAFMECLEYDNGDDKNDEEVNSSLSSIERHGYLSKVHTCAKILSVSIELSSLGDIGLSSSSEGECDLINIKLLEYGIKLCSIGKSSTEFDCSVHLRITLANILYRRNMRSRFVTESDIAISLCNSLIQDENDGNKVNVAPTINRLLHHYPGMESYKNIVLEQYLSLLKHREEVFKLLSLEEDDSLASHDDPEYDIIIKTKQSKTKCSSFLQAKPMIKLLFSTRNIENGPTSPLLSSSTSSPLNLRSVSSPPMSAIGRTPSRSPSPPNHLSSSMLLQTHMQFAINDDDEITQSPFSADDASTLSQDLLYIEAEEVEAPTKVWNILTGEEKDNIVKVPLDIMKIKIDLYMKEMNIEMNPWIMIITQNISSFINLINIWTEYTSTTSQFQPMKIMQSNSITSHVKNEMCKIKYAPETKIVIEDIQYILEKLEEIFFSINYGPVQFHDPLKLAQLGTEIQLVNQKDMYKLDSNQNTQSNIGLIDVNKEDYLSLEIDILNERNKDQDALLMSYQTEPMMLLDHIVCIPISALHEGGEIRQREEGLGVESIIQKIENETYAIVNSYEYAIAQHKRKHGSKSSVMDTSKPSFRLGIAPRNVKSCLHTCLWKPKCVMSKRSNKGDNVPQEYISFAIDSLSTSERNTVRNNKKKKKQIKTNSTNDANTSSKFIQHVAAQASLMKPLAQQLSQLCETIELPNKIISSLGIEKVNGSIGKNKGQIYEYEVLKKLKGLITKEIVSFSNIDSIHQLSLDVKILLDTSRQLDLLLSNQILQVDFAEYLGQFISNSLHLLNASRDLFKVAMNEQTIFQLFEEFDKISKMKQEVNDVKDTIELIEKDIKNDEVHVNDDERSHIIHKVREQLLGAEVKLPPWILPLATKRHNASEEKNKLTGKSVDLKVMEYKLYERFGFLLKRFAENVLLALLVIEQENENDQNVPMLTTMGEICEKNHVPLYLLQTIMWKAEEYSSLGNDEKSQINMLVKTIKFIENSYEFKLLLMESSAKVLRSHSNPDKLQIKEEDNGDSISHFQFLMNKAQEIKDISESLHQLTSSISDLSVFNSNKTANMAQLSIASSDHNDHSQAKSISDLEKDIETMKHNIVSIEIIRKNKLNQIQELIDSKAYCEAEVLRKLSIRNQIWYSMLARCVVDRVLEWREVEHRLHLEQSISSNNSKKDEIKSAINHEPAQTIMKENSNSNNNHHHQDDTSKDIDEKKDDNEVMSERAETLSTQSSLSHGLIKSDTFDKDKDALQAPPSINQDDLESNTTNSNDEWIPVGRKNHKGNKKQIHASPMQPQTKITSAAPVAVIDNIKSKASNIENVSLPVLSGKDESHNHPSIQAGKQDQVKSLKSSTSSTAEQRNKRNKKSEHKQSKSDQEIASTSPPIMNQHLIVSSTSTQRDKQQKKSKGGSGSDSNSSIQLNEINQSRKQSANDNDDSAETKESRPQSVSQSQSKSTRTTIDTKISEQENEMVNSIIYSSSEAANSNMLSSSSSSLSLRQSDITDITQQHQKQSNQRLNPYQTQFTPQEEQHPYYQQLMYDHHSMQGLHEYHLSQGRKLNLYVRPSQSYFYNNLLPLYVMPDQMDSPGNMILNFSHNTNGAINAQHGYRHFYQESDHHQQQHPQYQWYPYISHPQYSMDSYQHIQQQQQQSYFLHQNHPHFHHQQQLQYHHHYNHQQQQPPPTNR